MSSLLFDTHCHLNDKESFPEPDLIIEESKQAGVGGLIIIGVDLASSERALEIAENHENVYAVVGIHPNYSADFQSSHLEDLRPLAIHPKCVAIGEIGLDFHWDYATPEAQTDSTLTQLSLARETGLPVVIHCRDAYPDLLSLLEAEPTHPYLFHCFAGNEHDAKRCLELGAYFGVDGPLTYKKSAELRAIMQSMPHDRIVIETDAPYLTPEPFRGQKNHPKHVRLVNLSLAQCLGLDPVVCASLTTTNACRYFRIPTL